jgi:hypothetical protein
MDKRAKESKNLLETWIMIFFSRNEAHQGKTIGPRLLCRHILHSHVKDRKDRKKERRYNSIFVSGIGDSTREFVRIDRWIQWRYLGK